MTLFTQRNLILMVSLFVTITFSAQQDRVYQNNFDHLPTGQYNEEEIKEALGAHFCKGADEGRVFISEFQNKGNVLKVKYPKGKVKTNDSGMHTKVYWDSYTSLDELYFSYQVYIPEDFEFRAGAKLPGLAYQTSEKNMSLRLMWRYDGLLEFYNHFNTRPSWDGWRASVNWSLIEPYEEPGGPQPDQVKLKKGAWNHIEVYHKLNTPGQNDGIMRGWLNGELAIDIIDNSDYRQNGEGDIGMNNIYLSTFFGGSSDDYKPTKDLYAYFDNFIVSKTRIGYDGGVNNPGGSNQLPSVSFKTPSTNSTIQEGYSSFPVEVNAFDNDGSISNVKLYIDDELIRQENIAPYTWGNDRNANELLGLTVGNHTFKAVATDDKGATSETTFILKVEREVSSSVPDISFITPTGNLTVTQGYDLEVDVDAKDRDGSIADVKLYINNNFIRKERKAPYTWGHSGSPDPEELNGLEAGVYTIKAVATDNEGKTNQATLTLTVENSTACSFLLPDSKGLKALDNVHYNYAHIMGGKSSTFLSNFVSISIKWNPKYNGLYKLAFQTNNGSPDWYIDYSKTADFQLRDANPEITLKNTGFEGLDDDYWVTMDNGELVLKSKNSQTLICFSNSAQPPVCMSGKSQKVISIDNTKNSLVYPNPVIDILSIDDLPRSAYQIEIYDFNGKKVFSKPISSNQSKLKLDLNELLSGFYFVKILSSQQDVIKTKFAKN
ncbi:polysaccharide lyase [Aquimarina sp. MMG016]|uniref:T9SS type A sorting domain-containing protein n=1 Tax=Aquimarina sp. MMG016 TaxID=2822690 RepID=UPI001B3A2179|nr:Ig-like domain-containing protein [Aquimarina sp. MMG016]MBQ4819518.1 T9SS type A sorting domain-containing protein [Aquimarina sp. MMG016]